MTVAPFTVAQAERIVLQAGRMGLEWTRENYDELRCVTHHYRGIELPDWDTIHRLLAQSAESRGQD